MGRRTRYTFEIRARYLDSEDEDWQTTRLEGADSAYIGVDLYFWEQNIAPNLYTSETEDERKTAREFIGGELERQSERESYGSERYSSR